MPATAEATVFVANDLSDLPRALGLPDPCVCESTAGTCTLHAAVQTANLCPGADEIQLVPGSQGSYVLDIMGPSEDLAATGIWTCARRCASWARRDR